MPEAADPSNRWFGHAATSSRRTREPRAAAASSTTSPNVTWSCCARPARENPNLPERACSNRSGRSSSRSNQTCNGQPDLERHGGKTPAGVIIRTLSRILALTAAIWHNDKTGQTIKRSLTAYDN
jgi:hypothetical protein